MGEYADDQFRRDVMSKHGFDPGSMYSDSAPKSPRKDRIKCSVCGRLLATLGLNDHMKAKHTNRTGSKR